MKAGMPKQLEYYVKEDGSSPFAEWFNSLKDKQAKAKIQTRLDRFQGTTKDWQKMYLS